MKAQASNGSAGRKRNTVGNVSSQAGGKRSMGRRNGAPAATADGYARLAKQAKTASAKKKK